MRFGYDSHIYHKFILETGLSEEYQLPYYDILPGDPCFVEVREVVLTANKRPLVPCEWLKDEVSWFNLTTERIKARQIMVTLNTQIV